MNGYTVVASGRDITSTVENYIGTTPRNKVTSHSDAVKRKKVLLSYRSVDARVKGITEIILKVENNIIIGK